MEAIDIVAIERRARALRAREMQRLSGIFADRMGAYGRLVRQSFIDAGLAAANLIRPLFSWNPQARRPSAFSSPSLATRANRLLRGLFAWNPRPSH